MVYKLILKKQFKYHSQVSVQVIQSITQVAFEHHGSNPALKYSTNNQDSKQLSYTINIIINIGQTHQ